MTLGELMHLIDPGAGEDSLVDPAIPVVFVDDVGTLYDLAVSPRYTIHPTPGRRGRVALTFGKRVTK